MPAPIVVAEHLCKKFESVVAVEDLTLKVYGGELFGLVGPDGAGKTTSIRMLCGILQPTAGTGNVAGNDLLADAERLKSKIGYLSQRSSLYGDLTVDENIQFFAEIHNVRNYRHRLEELLAFTRLTPFRERLADQLSGGMRQKLALACTLIHTPEVIFLDEPTTGVDPISRREFWHILSDLLKSGITILMSTPYLDEAERCSRVGLMNHGSLMVVDTPSNVKSQMKGEVVELVTETVRPASALLKLRAGVEVQTFGDRLNVVVKDSRTDLPRLRQILEGEGIPVSSVRTISPSLENVFISLLSKKQ
jgi:ABC-2 type transport system ATP-binding protein